MLNLARRLLYELPLEVYRFAINNRHRTWVEAQKEDAYILESEINTLAHEIETLDDILCGFQIPALLAYDKEKGNSDEKLKYFEWNSFVKARDDRFFANDIVLSRMRRMEESNQELLAGYLDTWHAYQSRLESFTERREEFILD